MLSDVEVDSAHCMQAVRLIKKESILNGLLEVSSQYCCKDCFHFSTLTATSYYLYGSKPNKFPI